MKKSEIVVGESYAHSRNQSYRPDGRNFGFSARGVTVLSEPVTKKSARYPYTVTSMVEVKDLLSDNVWSVPTREIRELWAPYAKEAAEWRRNVRVSQNRRAVEQDRRAQSLRDIIPALRHAGVQDETHHIYDSTVIALLQKHVPDIVMVTTNEHSGSMTTTITAPLARDIKEYVLTNKGFTLTAECLMEAIR